MQKKVIAYILLMIFAAGQCLGADCLKPVREVEAGSAATDADLKEAIDYAVNYHAVLFIQENYPGISINVKAPKHPIGLDEKSVMVIKFLFSELIYNAMRYSAAYKKKHKLDIPLSVEIDITQKKQGDAEVTITNLSDPISKERLGRLSNEEVEPDARLEGMRVQSHGRGLRNEFRTAERYGIKGTFESRRIGDKNFFVAVVTIPKKLIVSPEKDAGARRMVKARSAEVRRKSEATARGA